LAGARRIAAACEIRARSGFRPSPCTPSRHSPDRDLP
jgi:hypothetical protein